MEKRSQGGDHGPREIPVIQVAATYIGTVVGAGFASGQEVLQFFGLHGPRGLFAIAIAILGFFLFGYASFEIGRKTKARSHGPIMITALGRTLSPLVDFVTTFFLFGALSTMISGAGSLVAEEFSLPWSVGAIAMAFLTLVTTFFGLKGVMYAVSSVVPFLLGGVFLVGAFVLFQKGVHLRFPPEGFRPVISSWAWAGLNYVSYNMIMAVPVLSAMGASLSSSKESAFCAFWGSAGLGAGLLITYLSIVTSFPQSLGAEVPMAKMANDIHHLAKPFFATIFLAEVYTTAVANLFGFGARIKEPGTKGFKWAIAITTLVSLAVASIGFTSLIRVVYPVTGWVGFLFLMGLFFYLIKTEVLKRRTGS